MDSKVIDGRALALKREEKLKEKIQFLYGRTKSVVKVVSILIGDDPSSVLYTTIKQKKAQELGIGFEPIHFPETADFDKVAEKIKSLNQDESIHGEMVQLPLPQEFLKGRDSKQLLNLINPKKDIDGLRQSPFLPAAVVAILTILEEEKITVKGKNVVVVGASDLVGKPAARELEKLGAIVQIADSQTQNLEELTEKANILISATGMPGLITGKMVKTGVVIIDVGAEKVNGKVVGDVDFASVSKKASKITPVPGGVGPLTVISLMENVVEAASKKNN